MEDFGNEEDLHEMLEKIVSLRGKIEDKIDKLFEKDRNVSTKTFADKIKVLKTKLKGVEQLYLDTFLTYAHPLSHGKNPFISNKDIEIHIQKFNVISSAVDVLLKKRYGPDYVYSSDIDQYKAKENERKRLAEEKRIEEERIAKEEREKLKKEQEEKNKQPPTPPPTPDFPWKMVVAVAFVVLIVIAAMTPTPFESGASSKKNINVQYPDLIVNNNGANLYTISNDQNCSDCPLTQFGQYAGGTIIYGNNILRSTVRGFYVIRVPDQTGTLRDLLVSENDVSRQSNH